MVFIVFRIVSLSSGFTALDHINMISTVFSTSFVGFPGVLAVPSSEELPGAGARSVVTKGSCKIVKLCMHCANVVKLCD